MKRIAALILTLALVFSSFSSMMFSTSAEGTPTITCGSAECYAGEDVTIDAVISDNPGVMYLLITPSFSTELGTPTISNENGLISGFEEGVNYSWTANKNVTANGTLISLTFSIGDSVLPGDYDVSFIYRQAWDYDESSVSFTVVSGTVTVKPVAVTGVTLDTTAESVNIGSSATLTPVVAPANASNKNVTWTTSDSTVATVEDGVVTGLKKGSATITVKTEDGDFEATCTVTVVCEHVWVEDAQAEYLVSAANCVNKAIYYKSCSVCGDKSSETFEHGEKNAANHTGNTYKQNEKAATCYETGYTGDVYCTDCRALISSGSVIQMSAHTPDTAWTTDGTYHWHKCLNAGCTEQLDKAAHAGGTATCAAKAVCAVCSVEYGEKDATNHTGETEIRDAVQATCGSSGYTGDTYCKACGAKLESGSVIDATGEHVDADGKWETDGINHWHTCTCGAVFDTAAHTGGTATCVAKAVCTVCSVEYGEKNAANHTGNNETRNQKDATCCEDGFTGDTYCKDCGTKLVSGEIISSTGMHVDVDGAWETDGTNHWHTCYFGTKFDTAAHTGGTATCVAKAVCTVCSVEYGEKNAENHVGETEIRDAVKETCSSSGFTGDTYCKACGAKLSSGSVISPNGNHVDANGRWETDGTNHWHTCGCGATFDVTAHTGGSANCAYQAVCSVCGRAYGEKNPAIHPGYTVTRDDYDATCCEEGYSGDIYCWYCDALLEKGGYIESTGDHVDEDGKWEYDGTKHFHTCYYGTTFDYESHTGGTATCKDKAICSVCGASYGEKNTSVHSGATIIKNAKEAKCNAEGYTGDTFCADCDTKLAEGKAIAKTSHKIAEWIVTKEATAEENGEKTGKCTYCGAEFKTETAKLSSKPIDEKNTKYEGMNTAPKLVPSNGTALPENAVFKAVKKEADDLSTEEKAEVEKAISEIESNAVSYIGKNKQAEKVDVVCVFSFDILLNNKDEASGESLGEEEYHFDGSVSVTVEMPEALKTAKNPVIVHLKDDGTCEPVDFVINADGTISFTVSGFSTFVILDVDTVEAAIKVLLGDVTGNGEVDIMDLIRLQKYIAGFNVELNADNADANESGNIDIFDLIRLKKMISGLV